MLDLIRSIDIAVAGYLAVVLVTLAIIGHGLVILKIIPYTWINGGRSVSYEAQKKQSILGIMVLLMMIPFFLIASNIITITLGSIGNSIISIMLWITAVLLAINTVMQLLGTTFERYVMSVILFLLLGCVLRMAL